MYVRFILGLEKWSITMYVLCILGLEQRKHTIYIPFLLVLEKSKPTLCVPLVELLKKKKLPIYSLFELENTSLLYIFFLNLIQEQFS